MGLELFHIRNNDPQINFTKIHRQTIMMYMYMKIYIIIIYYVTLAGKTSVNEHRLILNCRQKNQKREIIKF